MSPLRNPPLATGVVLALLVVAAPTTAAEPSAVRRHPDAGPVPAATTTPAAIPVPHCSSPLGVGGAVAGLSLVPAATDGTDGTETPPDTARVTRTAVVDRFEGDRAVLLVEARGEVVGLRVVRRTALPRAARHDDAVVTVAVVADAVTAVTYRPAETARRRRAVRRRFERLSESGPGRGGVGVC